VAGGGVGHGAGRFFIDNIRTDGTSDQHKAELLEMGFGSSPLWWGEVKIALK
jgi:hypothetical protein